MPDSDPTTAFVDPEVGRLILLTKGYSTIVDEENYEELSRWRWFAFEDHGENKTVYACRQVKGRVKFMHNFIMPPPEGMIVDHENRNGLDNRKRNFRICTFGENARNRGPHKKRSTRGRSQFKGVYYRLTRHGKPSCNPWVASIRIDGNPVYLGVFPTEEDAARAYDMAAWDYWGEFSYLNFPTEIKNRES